MIINYSKKSNDLIKTISNKEQKIYMSYKNINDVLMYNRKRKNYSYDSSSKNQQQAKF